MLDKSSKKQLEEQLRFQQALGGLLGSIFGGFWPHVGGQVGLKRGPKHCWNLGRFLRGPKVGQVPAAEAPLSSAELGPDRRGVVGEGGCNIRRELY